MAADSFDPITGAPQFSDNGAPDIAVDPTLVSAYAADVGNRIVRPNLAALESYEYARAGMEGYAVDTRISYVHTGEGWIISMMPLTVWTPTITGLAVGNGSLVTEYNRTGDLVNVFIEYTAGSTSSVSGTVSFTPPIGFASPTIPRHFGVGLLRVQATSAQYPFQGRHTGGASFNLAIPAVSGSAVGVGVAISSSFPTGANWGSGSTFYFQGTYKAAA